MSLSSAVLPLLVFAGLCGCSSAPTFVLVDGVRLPTLTHEFAGNPYGLRHSRAHPEPGGASSGLRSPGGTISGSVCGADINVEVEHRGDHVQLTGFMDPGAASQAAVGDTSRATS